MNKKDNPQDVKSINIIFRVTPTERKHLEGLAEKENLVLSKYIRKALKFYEENK